MMIDGPDLSRIASLVGDPARASMLTALMNGGALTASELALEAGVTPQTTSSHLGKLVVGGLLVASTAGRHRYYALAGPSVATMLEAIMGVAEAVGLSSPIGGGEPGLPLPPVPSISTKPPSPLEGAPYVAKTERDLIASSFCAWLTVSKPFMQFWNKISEEALSMIVVRRFIISLLVTNWPDSRLEDG